MVTKHKLQYLTIPSTPLKKKSYVADLYTVYQEFGHLYFGL
jgi:hypothetical protein